MKPGDLTCEEAKSLFERVIEGEARRGEESALKAHLASCEVCTKMFALDLALIETIKTSPEHAFASVVGEVMSRVDAKARRFTVLRWGVAVAAACCIGVVVNAFGFRVFNYIVTLVSGDAASRPEVAAVGKIASVVARLAGSLGSMLVEGVAAGGSSGYLPYILAVVTGGCIVVILMMYMMGLWLRKPGEVRRWH